MRACRMHNLRRCRTEAGNRSLAKRGYPALWRRPGGARRSGPHAAGQISLEKLTERVVSWIGHAQHADTYHLRDRLFREYVFCRPSRLQGEASREEPAPPAAWQPGGPELY